MSKKTKQKTTKKAPAGSPKPEPKGAERTTHVINPGKTA